MTTTPDIGLDDVIVPVVDLDVPVALGFDEPDTPDAVTADDSRVDPAVVRLADNELLGPDDTHLGIVEVELLSVDVHDGVDHSFDLDQLGPIHDEPSDLFGLDLDLGAG